MLESNVAKKVDPYFIDDTGKTVDSQYIGRRYKSRYKLAKPDWVLHSDEVRDNTNIKN